jgi:hypothetical protein
VCGQGSSPVQVFHRLRSQLLVYRFADSARSTKSDMDLLEEKKYMYEKSLKKHKRIETACSVIANNYYPCECVANVYTFACVGGVYIVVFLHFH